jgi:hypothetical protein
MSGIRCWNNFPSKALRDSNKYTDIIKSRTLYGYMKGVAKTNGPQLKANGSGKYYGGLYINPSTKCLVHSDSYNLLLNVTKGQYYCNFDLSNINSSFNGEMYQGSTLYSDYQNVDVTMVTSYDVSFGQPVLWLYLVDPSYTGTTYLYWDDTNPYSWPLISYTYDSQVSTNDGNPIYELYQSAIEQYMPYLANGQFGYVQVSSAGGDSNNSILRIYRTSNNTGYMEIFDNTFTFFTTVYYTFPYSFISLNLSGKFNYALWPPPFFSYGTEEGLINFPGVVTDPKGQIFYSSCREPSWLYRDFGKVDISFSYIEGYDYFGDPLNASGTPVIEPSKYAIQNAGREQLSCFQFPKCLKFE